MSKYFTSNGKLAPLWESEHVVIRNPEVILSIVIVVVIVVDPGSKMPAEATGNIYLHALERSHDVVSLYSENSDAWQRVT